MSTSRWYDKICTGAVALSLLLTVLLMGQRAASGPAVPRTLGYENRLFDTSTVHTIDLVIDDWEGFLENCEGEEYSACAVVIDGESVRNAGLRAKGNTSLSNVKQLDSSRYSLKIEFDHYQTGTTYHGLDKLCLNNLIQDNTLMKDYLVYTLMNDFGAEAPLCSYAFVTVNGEDWGLFLAVEGLEDAFLQRAYGSETGDLYKPDSMSFGGGRGNGRDFRMSEFDFDQFGPRRRNGDDSASENTGTDDSTADSAAPEGFPGSDFQFPGFPMGRQDGSSDFRFPGFPMGGQDGSSDFRFPGFPGGMGGGPGGGMGSNDVKLIYSDDDPDSYTNIFNNAKTDVTDGDKARLIAALKNLNQQTDLESTLNMDEVLRYFVVHNFVVNGDSYTGSMIHNYYLHERNGQLSMIPWDYNLAFGSFQENSADSAVNDPIDTPLSVNGDGDRPMADWIFSSEEYTALYHQYFQEFLDNLDLDAKITETAVLIDEYVQRDPTKFCTYEEFQTGVEALRQFCHLRAESVAGQLAGTIPSTDEGQEADNANLVDASGLTLSDMGSMGMGGGFGGRNSGGGGPGGFGGGFGFGRGGQRNQTGSSDTGGSSDSTPGGVSGSPDSGIPNRPDKYSNMERFADSIPSPPNGSTP